MLEAGRVEEDATPPSGVLMCPQDQSRAAVENDRPVNCRKVRKYPGTGADCDLAKLAMLNGAGSTELRG
jgi:hypothetical protein